MDTDRDRLIEKRAYEIWEEEGRPDGREQEHWSRAAKELEEATPVTSRAPGTPDALTGTGASAMPEPRKKPAGRPSVPTQPKARKPKPKP